MRWWQRVDLAAQALLIVGFTVAVLWEKDSMEPLLMGYFVVGGWQSLSMVVHQVYGGLLRRHNFRWWYHRVVLGVLVLGMITLFTGLWLFLMIGMLFAAPVMALAYFCACLYEVKGAERVAQ